MKEEGIEDGDILVIDKSLELMNDDLAVCFVDGEFTLKRVRIDAAIIWLVPSNKAYPEDTHHIRKRFHRLGNRYLYHQEESTQKKVICTDW